jgi:transposase
MDRRIEVEEAGRLLKVSVRQVYRVLKGVREEGIEGVIHGNRGRESPRKTKEETRERIVDLAKGRLKDINDQHLKEILEREEGIVLGRETLRRMLRGAGIAPKQKRKRPKYRSRRERKEAFGMMLQIDGSPHDWLEGRGPWLTLVGGIDDATSHAWAGFEKAETTWAYMELMRGIFSSHGMPLSLYSDRHSIFHALREPTIVEQLKNTVPLTQFGRAMDELGIQIIKAYSAPAKGRIERLWRTFQDRLAVELRLAGAQSLEEANEVLKRFLKEFNRRFTRKPKKAGSLFRKAPWKQQLDRILCLKESRVVKKDHTISFEGLILQIPPSKKFRSIAKKRVTVLQLRDGSVEIEYNKQTVARFSDTAIKRMIGNRNDEKCQLKPAA